ncbi:MAG: hypothetical protein LBR87_06765 [Synergistaceae bacterium]|jgi:hypothetical protein|nr:hypothetical protein [Synergistaceae bacterium]
MSVVAVSVISVYSLVKLLAVAGAYAAGTSVIKSIADRGDERRARAEGLMAEIALARGRIERIDDALEKDGISNALAELESSAEKRVSGDAKGLYDEMNAISMRIVRAELDAGQCRSRSETAENLIRSIKDSGMAGYEQEIERLEREMERTRSLSSEERMTALHKIIDALREMEMSMPKASRGETGTAAPARDTPKTAARAETRDMERNALLTEIRDLADRIASLDEFEGEKLRPTVEGLRADTNFPERLASLRRQFKTTWATIRERAASTSFFRNTLTELRNDLLFAPEVTESREGSKLIERCDALRGGTRIEREAFMSLYEDIARYVSERGEKVADSIFAGKVERTLAELGYELLPDELREGEEDKETRDALRPGEVRYLESPYKGYRMMIKAGDGGHVTTRLARVADAAGDRGGVTDREVGAKWCGDFDKFLDKMKDIGAPLDVTLRREPGETEVIVISADDSPRGKKGGKRRKKGGAEERAISLKNDGSA